MAELLNRKRVLMAKTQPTAGVDPLPDPAVDAVLTGEINITPLAADTQDRIILRPGLGSTPKIPTGIHVELTFAVELAGMKGLGVPTPGLSALLRCCAASETIVPTTSVTYAPVSGGFELATLYFNLDGVLHKVTDARGSAKITLAANGLPSIEFTIMGLFSLPTDTPQGVLNYADYQLPVEVNSANTTGIALHGFTGGILLNFKNIKGF